MSALTLQLVTRLDEFEALQEEWDRLALQLGDDSFFGRHVFARANLKMWMSQHGDRPEIYLLRNKEKLVAVAPFLRRPGPTGFFSLIWLESRTSIYAAFSVLPEYEVKVFELLGEALLSQARVRKIQSDYVPMQSALARFFVYLNARRSRIAVNSEARLDTEIVSSLSRKRRSAIRRLERRLAELGRLEHRIDTTKNNSGETVNWIIDHKIAQYASGDGSNWIEWPETRDYFISVSQALGDEGAAWTGELLLGGKLAAATLFFTAKERVWFSKTAYEPKFAAYSPGWIELTKSLEALRQEGFKEVDFMLGTGLVKSTLGQPGAGTCRYRVSLNPFSALTRRLRQTTAKA